MVNGKTTKRQAMVDLILKIKLKIEQHEQPPPPIKTRKEIKD
jgi:hypothetical protein